MFAYIFYKKHFEEPSFSVREYCRVLPVSETGYYKWLKHRSRKSPSQKLLDEIYKILEEHEDNDNYGVERMQIALAQKGIKKSYSTVKRAMKLGNLIHESKRSPDGLTKADKKALRPANVIDRDFIADKPNQKWLTDITEIHCADGKLYVAPVMDCFGGEIVACAMDTNMKKELCMKAAREAYKNRKPDPGLIFHSDSGSQYTSTSYKKLMGRLRFIQSMSDVGKCYDNSRMESFFATLKKEKIYKMDTTKMSVEEVKKIVWRYIFGYYNTVRISTVNGGLPPQKYRLMKTTACQAA